MSTRLPYFRIAPGGYIASKSEVVLSTILGSCVAVCLYDPLNRVVGMNHIMNSREESRAGKPFCFQEDGKYGSCGMALLFHVMIQQGASLNNVRAKVFGGASLLKPYDACSLEYCIGDDNVRYATSYLEMHSIPIVSKAVGGDYGRIIRFYSSDFTVWTKQIRKSLNPALIEVDNKAWAQLKQKDE